MFGRCHRSAVKSLTLLTTLLACGANQAAPRTGPAEPSGRSVVSAGNLQNKSTAISASNIDRLRLRWEVAAGGFTRGVALHSGFGKVFSASDKNVQTFAISDGKSMGTLKTCHDHIRGGLLRFSNSLLVVCESRTEQHDLKTGKSFPLETSSERVTATTLAKGRLALAHRDGVIRVLDLLGGPSIDVVVPGPPIDVKSLALSPDGDTLAVAWVQGSIWWWQLSKPTEPRKLVRYASESDTVTFSHDGKYFAEEGKRSTTTLWAFDGGFERQTELRNGAWVKRMLFLHDNHWLIRAGSDGLELAEALGRKRIALYANGQVEEAAMNEVGSLIAAGDRNGRLLLWAHE